MDWLSSLGVFGTILRTIIILFEVIVVFNLLILVHEWGHFLAARWRGLKIEKFQIWFGKPLWKKTINGVQYGLGSIPAGGFVALPQMAPMDAIEGGVNEPREKLPNITPMDKIIVAFAGPLFSFGLACLFALLVWQVGYPDRRIHTTAIGFVQPGSPGDEAGLKVGDTILEIDGVPVTSWDEPVNSVKERIAFSNKPKITFTVERPGEPNPVKIESGFKIEEGGFFKRKGLRTVGIVWKSPARVEAVKENSPADVAGIKPGDIFVAFNGVATSSPYPVEIYFHEHPDAEANVRIKRGDEELEMKLSARPPDEPVDVKLDPMTGIIWENEMNTQKVATIHPPPSVQISNAVTMMVRTIGGLVTPGSNVSFQHLSGPVMIGSIYYRLFKQPEGWRLVLWFSVILNVNLALLNMLPFPVLDGGHITMALLEMVRRRPVLHVRALEIFQTACALMLISFIIYVTWFDTWSLAGDRDPAANVKLEDIRFHPPPSNGSN